MNVSHCLDSTIHARLSELESLVELGDEVELAVLAKTELPRLCAAWSELLRLHQPDAYGQCVLCPVAGRRLRRRTLCDARVVLHACLTAVDVSAAHGRGCPAPPGHPACPKTRRRPTWRAG
jgi:hypothetical protein